LTVRVREETICVAIVARMERRGYRTHREFPILGKIADVYAVHPRTGVTVSVECKERDWVRGILQARVYQGASDYVYMALPRRRTTTRVLERLMERGIGLIVVDGQGRTRQVLDARRATHLTPALHQRAKQNFEALKCPLP
jgi:hypothetical protein